MEGMIRMLVEGNQASASTFVSRSHHDISCCNHIRYEKALAYALSMQKGQIAIIIRIRIRKRIRIIIIRIVKLLKHTPYLKKMGLFLLKNQKKPGPPYALPGPY